MNSVLNIESGLMKVRTMSEDIVDILKDAGFGVVEGKVEVLEKINELGQWNKLPYGLKKGKDTWTVDND